MSGFVTIFFLHNRQLKSFLTCQLNQFVRFERVSRWQSLHGMWHVGESLSRYPTSSNIISIVCLLISWNQIPRLDLFPCSNFGLCFGAIEGLCLDDNTWGKQICSHNELGRAIEYHCRHIQAAAPNNSLYSLLKSQSTNKSKCSFIQNLSLSPLLLW